jgi:LexA-binding, inner membrane-associated putative hydrolase
MLLGHYGAAFAAKRYAPRTSLGMFNLAAQFLDELWPIFVLMGLETVRVAPGVLAANPLEFVHYPITHSLVGAIGWSVLLGGLYYAMRQDRRASVVVGALVLSHWFLDLPMHAADLPLWPGSTIKVGLAAWRSVPLTIAIELSVFVSGLVIYLRTTRALDVRGRWGLWLMVIVLFGIFFGGFFSPPPTEGRAAALGALGLWLFAPWGWWVDRHREVVGQAGAVVVGARRAG